MSPAQIMQVSMFLYALLLAASIGVLSRWKITRASRYLAIKKAVRLLVGKKLYRISVGLLYMAPLLAPGLPIGAHLVAMVLFLLAASPFLLAFTIFFSKDPLPSPDQASEKELGVEDAANDGTAT